MSKASILRQLSDEDLEAVHHLIRRDAEGDLAIARAAEVRGQRALRSLGEAGRSDKKFSLGASDAAKAMVVGRYRHCSEYKKWLLAWENRDAELRKAIETQKQRFEFISNLVRGTDKAGLESVSNGLMARMLTLAAELPDEALLEAAGRGGWVGKVFAAVNEQQRIERARAGEKAIEVTQDKKLSPAERESRLKEIFGIA